MDHDTNKILHVETVDKREVRLQSPNMEREAFMRSMTHILEFLQCPEVITDASSSIRKIIGTFKVYHCCVHTFVFKETKYPNMVHSLDVWHKAKILKKALAEVTSITA